MSNVKTGDLAWLVSAPAPHPVCTVGPLLLEENYECLLTTGAIVPGLPLDITEPHWWCSFREPIIVGEYQGVESYSNYFPVADFNLRKILGGETPATELQVFSPAPVDAEERARVREEKDKSGTVKPRRKATKVSWKGWAPF